ncbi:MAG: ribonuclease P protein component [Candidatus Dormibacteria bacterium]
MGQVATQTWTRLTPKSEVRRVKRQGVRRRVGSVSVFVHIHEPADDVIRFAVSTRKMKGAVKRNRIRRRLKEALKMLRQYVRTGCDLVLVGDEQVATLLWSSLISEVEGALAHTPASKVLHDVHV